MDVPSGKNLQWTDSERAIVRITREAVRRSGLTMRSVAEKTGRSPGHIADLLNERKHCTLGDLIALSSAAGLSLFDVIARADDLLQAERPADVIAFPTAGRVAARKGRKQADEELSEPDDTI